MGDTRPAVVAEGGSNQSRAESPAPAPVVNAEKQQQEQVENEESTPAVETASGTAAPAPAPAPAANGRKPEGTGEEGPVEEVAPSSEPPTPSTRKRKAGQDAPPAEGAESKPAQQHVGLAGGVKREDLAAAVRARMDEVLKEGEDNEMRQDARLVNFLGEVEEAQVHTCIFRCPFLPYLLFRAGGNRACRVRGLGFSFLCLISSLQFFACRFLPHELVPPCHGPTLHVALSLEFCGRHAVSAESPTCCPAPTTLLRIISTFSAADASAGTRDSLIKYENKRRYTPLIFSPQQRCLLPLYSSSRSGWVF